MTDEVQASYDEMAERYAELFLSGLDDDGNARDWLARFAGIAADQNGPVADVGCGPGLVTAYLVERGLNTIGSDLSPGQIAQARKAFPALDFHVGDLAKLVHADNSLGGIVSRYSIIHTPPRELETAFAEWRRALEPGAPLLVSFFGSLAAADHGTPFDHKVVTAYELFPATIAEHLADVGFGDVEFATLPPPEGGRPFDQATVLAVKPTA